MIESIVVFFQLRKAKNTVPILYLLLIKVQPFRTLLVSPNELRKRIYYILLVGSKWQPKEDKKLIELAE